MNSPAALVTGASGAIGAATARLLDRRGWRVFGTHLEHPEEVPSACTSYRIDFSGPSRGSRSLAETLESRLGRLSLVVHAAGLVRDAALPRMKQVDWRRVRRVHLDAAFYLCRHLNPLLTRGRDPAQVLFLTSKTGIEGTAGQGNYAAAKAGLIGLAISLAREWAPGIHVNVLRPPLTPSRMTKTLSRNRASTLLEGTLTGDWAPPRQIAEAVAYLADQSALSGQVSPVDNRIRSPWN